MKTVSSWSGGKDSCYAFMKAIDEGYKPTALLNIMNENGKVSRSHGLSLVILKQQAEAIGVPLHATPATWKEYEKKYIKTLKIVKEKYGIEAAVFGDIDLQAHRDWEEKVCEIADLVALLPLWQGERRQLVINMINSGIKAVIVSCNTEMGEKYLGREITIALIDELESQGIDVCGENGEYHTVVIDCPIFSKPIILPEYSKNTYEDYCFINWSS